MNYKYLILDFGNVLVTPTTGDWHITPKFKELIDINKIDMDKYNEMFKKYSYLLSEKLLTQEEEYDMFIRFYDGILSNINYPGYNKKIVEEIAYDRTYNNSKYTLCDNVINELKELKKKYKLIMLTDNWPCVIPYLKDNGLYDFFDKIYISSVYQELKKDGVFFDHPISDFNIKPGEALFIDDTESLLDVAKNKGFDCMLMDRYKKTKKSKYKIINDLNNL
jgi:putative hydrolase of the HAD superfamily